jgi:divalent metal cation (Fe/Co/Zn/Cd) transporter
MTFGYHRVGVFAALCNAVSLLVIAIVIGWEAIARIREPETTNGVVMIGVAALVPPSIMTRLSCTSDTPGGSTVFGIADTLRTWASA